MEKLSRRFIADSLKKASFGYFLKLGYSCFTELGVCSQGKLRADVLAVNLKAEVVIGEIKSSVSDFINDEKWEGYLPYCNRFFFVFSDDTWTKLKPVVFERLKLAGAGVLVLDPASGLLHVRLPC
jgi:hypothetical protein